MIYLIDVSFVKEHMFKQMLMFYVCNNFFVFIFIDFSVFFKQRYYQKQRNDKNLKFYNKCYKSGCEHYTFLSLIVKLWTKKIWIYVLPVALVDC